MTTKLTAANTPVLSRIKKLYAAGFFKSASKILNEQGEDALIAHYNAWRLGTDTVTSIDEIGRR